MLYWDSYSGKDINIEKCDFVIRCKQYNCALMCRYTDKIRLYKNGLIYRGEASYDLLDKIMENILEIKHLNFEYEGNKKVLDDVSLSISKGEKIVILGANGAGKSTLFLNINGVLKSNSGDIIYRGTRITKKNLNDLRKNVGLVFQEADNQIIAGTVLAEVSFGPMNMKLSKEEVEERVNEAMEYMNISEFRNRPPHYLSGGEKKRVGIADIIAMKPEIIIFDEPTASLDPINAQMLEEVLFKLSKEDKTIIIAIHDVDFAFRFADRIIVMSEGKIIADDTPINIFNNDEVLSKSNLKKPTLLEVHNTLVAKGVWKEDVDCPRSVEEFKRLMSK